MRATWLFCFWMLGCGDDKDTGEPVDTGPFDNDGDGWIANEDCDDEDPTVFHDALEYCDGKDNNCDQDIDENTAVDALTWCADADLDGYGVDSGCTRSCESPGDGYADNTDDCDDANAYINPEGVEECDLGDRDEDCDGLAEEEDPDVDPASLTLYYPDADGDGYGDMNAEGEALCNDPTTSTDRYADNNDDCDDDSRRLSPDEEEEIGDEIDNNCNGCVDEIAGADEEPGNGVDDDCDSCVDEDEDDGLLNWFYTSDYDVWWNSDWCQQLETACDDCDWGFVVAFEYNDDLSSGASDVGLNFDFEWTLAWGAAYPETVWYYSSYGQTWYPIFEGGFDSESGKIEFIYGYWDGDGYPQL